MPARSKDHDHYGNKPGVRGCCLRRGCFLVLLGTILALGLTALLGYGLLQIPSPTNILILGVDKRPGEGNTVRTDTMLLLRSDPARAAFPSGRGRGPQYHRGLDAVARAPGPRQIAGLVLVVAVVCMVSL